MPLAFAVILAGCATPGRPIPTDRAMFEGRAYGAGHADLNPHGPADVVTVERAGLREDATVFLLWREKQLEIEVLDPGTDVPRPPQPVEVDEAAKLLSPLNPAWPRLQPWLARRTSIADIERELGAQAETLRDPGLALILDLGDAFREESRAAELRDKEALRRDTFFAGLFGWGRGATSGYSWSFPFHVERYDRADDLRELALFPILTGIRSAHGGTEVVCGPLLGYCGDVETPTERQGGFVLLGAGRVWRESARGAGTLTLALPLLFAREQASGEDVPADPGRLVAGERTATHLLGSLVSWGTETPGIYRDGKALRAVGRDRSSWRVLPLASHKRDERGSETMLWPLLGFGWGDEDGKGYVRLLYFIRIGA